MIAAWMLWSVGTGLLFVVAALATERLVNRSRRWAWAAAAAGSVAVPAVRFLADAGGAANAPSAAGLPVALEPLAVTVAGDSLLHSLDGALLAGWAALSCCVAVGVLVAGGRLLRRRRSWRPGTLRGRDVLWSAQTGPAVLGLVAPRIVLPEWMRDAAPARQELVLVHEEEHLRTRDVQLRFLALLAVTAFPWNPALWFQYRRLGQALEMDCDRRVVARMPRHRRLYGNLLLDVGARSSGLARLAAGATISEPRSFVERRIRGLLRRAPQVRLAQAAFLAFAAVFAVGLAMIAPGVSRDATEPKPSEAEATPSETEPAPPAAPRVEPPTEPSFTPYTMAPTIVNGTEVRRVLAREYPPLLREAGVGGTASVLLYVDETGNPRRVRLHGSSGHAALDAAAIRVAESFNFSPAKNREETVAAWISLPIVFASQPSGEAGPTGEAGSSGGSAPGRSGDGK